MVNSLYTVFIKKMKSGILMLTNKQKTKENKPKLGRIILITRFF